MELQKRFDVIYSEEVITFLQALDKKASAKIMYNVGKAQYSQDPKLFKKLEGHEIWEFRTLYNGIQYRLLAFWDDVKNSYVIVTHGFVKKTKKTPLNEIKRAEIIKQEYNKQKNK